MHVILKYLPESSAKSTKIINLGETTIYGLFNLTQDVYLIQ